MIVIGILKKIIALVQKPFSLDGYIFFIGITLAYLLINFNDKFGYTFGFLAVFSIFFSKIATGKYFPIEKDSIRFPDILWAIGGVAAYLLIASLISVTFGAGDVSQVPRTIGSVLEKFGSTIPAYQGSQIATIFAFGFDVPFVESIFFTMAMFALAKWFSIDLTKLSIGSIGIITLTSYGFMQFHATARQIAPGVFDTTALLITFVFMFVSLFLLIVRGEKEVAPIIWMHILVNVIALLVRFKNPVTMSVLASLGVS